MGKKVFDQALSNMSFDMAARGAIRHLHDSGYTAAEISERLSYPLSIPRIKEEISLYEEEKSSPDAKYEFIRTTDAYGRSSYKRVRIDEGRSPEKGSD